MLKRSSIADNQGYFDLKTVKNLTCDGTAQKIAIADGGSAGEGGVFPLTDLIREYQNRNQEG